MGSIHDNRMSLAMELAWAVDDLVEADLDTEANRLGELGTEIINIGHCVFALADEARR